MSLLDDANIAVTAAATVETNAEHSQQERELEWLLLSKVAIQTYGIVLNSLVDQTLPLSEDLFYWDEVLSSTRSTAFYLLQTFPSRTYDTSKDVILESLRRLEEIRHAERPAFLRGGTSSSSNPTSTPPSPRTPPTEPADTFSDTASKFYGLVKNTINDRAYAYHVKAVSPFSLARNEIREKQSRIRKLREMQAAAVGVLIGEGLSFEFEEESDEWRGIIERAVLLMENVVRNVYMVDHSLEDFEETVFNLERPSQIQDESSEGLQTQDSSSRSSDSRTTTAALSSQLRDILINHLPAQGTASKELIYTHGRPGLITRYWFPATALLLSSTTILRILVRNRDTLENWIREFGATTVDFWYNWVITPIRNIIGTIRHNEDSEVALMSRKSLAADMDSLQNMVVDFSLDNPSTLNATTPLTTGEIEILRQNVREGDLSSVLRAYEHDLRSPLKGAVRGQLIRALLIQIQKTKVDVEVAISGIDRLLKSQELVFGFVGLTPGIVISAVVIRWVASLSRRGQTSSRVKGQAIRRLRNVDKILTASSGMRGENGGCLDYKEHGLLLCEVHALRQESKRMLKRDVWGEFVTDLEELVDVRSGVSRQLRVVDRVRW